MYTRVLGGLVAAIAFLSPAVLPAVHSADSTRPGDAGHSKHAPFTYAVYGDAPYGTSPTDTSETDATPAFIAAVNADPLVSGVLHVGDIHSGSQYCTQSYDQQIYDLWTAFADPMVYTPGDNEWADCHKKKEGGGAYNATTGAIDYVLGADGQPVDYAKGDPAANLGLVRSIFFAQPGHTLGSDSLRVTSQATAYDRRHPEDRAFIENVRWTRNDVVFVTINVPGGSNLIGDPWYGVPAETAQQAQLRAALTGAATRWITAAFEEARHSRAAGVVIVDQADMWDVDGNPAGTAHLSNFEPIIKTIADQTKAFRRPVLMLNGDSHVYRSDNPLLQGAPCTGDDENGGSICTSDVHNAILGSTREAWNSHPSYHVPNFHRIVVHGSTTPLEYLRLTVDPKAHNASTDTTFGIFSWARVTD
ncbi:hypothetical protein [Microbacterium deminutum]|uniref:Calcineurin-like phosphoesterase domain-containing protein n=1 Tax=Microbacterium deminutum TaxID=344164 RepID=A0ABP5CAK0_9MICO